MPAEGAGLVVPVASAPSNRDSKSRTSFPALLLLRPELLLPPLLFFLRLFNLLELLLEFLLGRHLRTEIDLSAEGLGNMRKYAVVGILVLAALVTPPDVITQVILFVVVYGLYEVSIQLVRRIERKREANLKAQGLWDEDIHGEGAFADDDDK